MSRIAWLGVQGKMEGELKKKKRGWRRSDFGMDWGTFGLITRKKVQRSKIESMPLWWEMEHT